VWDFASYTAKTKKGGIRNTLKPVQKGLMSWLRLCCYHNPNSQYVFCVISYEDKKYTWVWAFEH